jgi:Holliday junction resolvasome RuvABC endonuclease subunit
MGMRALGVHIRIAGGRYIAGFVWVEDDRLIDSDSFPAPADRNEACRLGELYERTAGILGEAAPDLFGLKVSEINRQSASAVVAHRAEGVVLGATIIHPDLPIEQWSRQRLFSPAGLDSRAKGSEVVDALCTRLNRVPDKPECQQAAAAAVGSLIAAGVL